MSPATSCSEMSSIQGSLVSLQIWSSCTPPLLVLLKSYAICPYEVDVHVINANRWRKSLLKDKNERLCMFLGYLMHCSCEEVNRWCCYSPLPAGSFWNYCRGSVNHLQGPSVEILHQWPSSLALSCKVLYIKTQLPRQQVHVHHKGREVTLEAPSSILHPPPRSLRPLLLIRVSGVLEPMCVTGAEAGTPVQHRKPSLQPTSCSGLWEETGGMGEHANPYRQQELDLETSRGQWG